MANKPERQPSGRWRLRWRYGGTQDGAWQSVTWDNRADVMALKREVEHRGHRVRRTDPDVVDMSIITGRPTRHSGGPTFAEAAEDFFTKRSGVKPDTIHGQRKTIRLRFAEWADLRVADLDTDDVADLVNRIEAKGHDPRPAVRVGRSVMMRQKRLGNIAANPFDGVVVSSRPKGPPKGVTPAEYPLLMATAVNEQDRLMIWLGWETGLRVAEACALRPEALVDPLGEAPQLVVSGTVTRGRHKRWEVLATKGRETRTISIPHDLARALHEASKGQEWIFPKPDGGMMPPSTVQSRWQRRRAARVKAGLRKDLSFHDLRHGHATFLLNHGFSIADVSLRLGHASPSFTADTYIQPTNTDVLLRALYATQPARGHLRSVE